MVNGMIAVPCDSNKVSDGVHTFGELYAHRNHLLIALMKSHPELSPWRSLQHDNGSFHDGWFIAGMKTPKGDITYHLPESMWYMLDGITTLDKAPKFDGHTSQDVLDRLCDWIVDYSWGRKDRGR